MPAAITAENLVRKLCFVIYGPNFELHSNSLKRDMYRYLRSRNDRFISRQAVKNWFDKKSVPSRVDAISFLYLFFINSADRTSRTDEQKRVYDQLQQFFKATESQETYRVAGADFFKPHVVADHRQPTLQISIPPQSREALEEIIGHYALFHRRLVEDAKGHTALERMEIFWKGGAVIGRVHFMDTASRLRLYEGEFFRVGSLIWYIGSLTGTEDHVDRLRVMAFRRNGPEKDPYDALRWGLLLSDVPHPTAHIPASCRVVLLRLEKYQVEAELPIGPVHHDQMTGPEWEIIARLTDNNTTSVSEHNTVEPLDKMEIFNENILKTDHRTIERACELFRRNGYRPFWTNIRGDH
jgi:hypothetical protein